MRNEGYVNALSALQFFCFEGDMQVDSLDRLGKVEVPVFFPSAGADAKGCDYFFGVAGVLKTYIGYLFDHLGGNDSAEHLEALSERIGGLMLSAEANKWSEGGVKSLPIWNQIRSDAKRALRTLGEPLPDVIPVFNIAALIDPDEFRTTDEARQYLE